MSGARFLTMTTALIAVLALGLWIGSDKAASGVGHQSADGPRRGTPPLSWHGHGPAPEVALSLPAETEGSTSPAPADDGDAADAVSAGAFSSVTPHDLAQLDEGYQVTPEGLAEYTVNYWAIHEDFMALSKEEAAELLGEDLGTYPSTLQEYLGGFPTIEDCEEALTHADVVRQLRDLILLDAELAKIAMQEIERGATPATADRKKLAQASKDGVELRLWRKLDEVTSYKNWTTLGRLFREWSR